MDEEGNTTDQLSLTTDTLVVTNLEDTDTSEQMGIDLSTGSSTTIGGNFSGHEKEQSTYATIGLGNVTVGGENIDDQAQFADLNRDTATSQEVTKDIERGGLDASLTVDHRLLTEAGRDKISEDIMKSGMLVDTAVLAATTDRVSLLDFNEELGKTHTVYETVKTEIAKDEKLAEKLQDPSLSAADKEVMLNQLTHAVMEELGYETEGYDNKIIADKTAVGTYEDGTGGKVAGFHSDETRDSYINDVNITSTSQLVNAGGHESSHEMDAQDGVTYSQSDNEAYANNFGSNFASYTNLALDINGYDSGMATTNNHVGNNTPLVLADTAEYNSLDKEQGDFMSLGLKVIPKLQKTSPKVLKPKKSEPKKSEPIPQDLLDQLPEIPEVTGEYTQDTTLADADLANANARAEKFSTAKAVDKGKKGAVAEFMRDMLKYFND